MISKKKYSFYFLLFIIMIFLFFFTSILFEYLFSVMFGAFFAVISYPLYSKMNRKFKYPVFNAFFLVATFTFVIVFLFILVLFFLISEINHILGNLDSRILLDQLTQCSNYWCKFLRDEVLMNYGSILVKVKDYLLDIVYNSFSRITSFVINFFVFVFSFFYLLKDGKLLLYYLDTIIPLPEEEKRLLYMKFRDVVSAVFGNSLLIAFIQGALVGIMFFMLGISAPILWTLVASFFSLIPSVGTGIVWVPVVVYFVLSKKYVSAVILAVWGTFIVGLIDNVLRPFLINTKVKIHPLVVFLSVLGGIDKFGIPGIFIGPIIASLLITLIKFYKLQSRSMLR